MSVTFNSIGAGSGATGSSTSLGTSWSHTISSSSPTTCVVVHAAWSTTSNTTLGSVTPTASYGGTAMTLLGGKAFKRTSGGSSGMAQASFILFNPPTGARTVSVAASGIVTCVQVMGNSVAYDDVSFVTLLKRTLGTGGAFTYNGPAGDYVTRMLVSASTFGTQSGGIQRYSAGASVSGIGDYAVIQDAPLTGAAVTLSYSSSSVPTDECGALVLHDASAANERLAAFPPPRTSDAPLTGPSDSITVNLGAGSPMAVLVGVHRRIATTTPLSLTYGGQAMTLLAATDPFFVQFFGTWNWSLYGLSNAPTGSQVLAFTGAQSSEPVFLAPVSYTGITSFASPQVRQYNSTPGSITVPSAEGRRTFFCGTTAAQTISSGRLLDTVTHDVGGGFFAELDIYDNNGATSSVYGSVIAGVAVDLIPTAALTGDSSLGVTALPSGVASRGQSVQGSLAVVAGTSAAATITRPVAASLAATAATTSTATESSVGAASLAVTASVSAGVSRNASASASLAVTASRTGNAIVPAKWSALQDRFTKLDPAKFYAGNDKAHVGSLTNLAPNGGYEDATSVYYSQTTADVARSGTRSGFLATAGNNLAAFYSPNQVIVPVRPGDVLYGEVWVYGKNTNVQSSFTSGVRLYAIWYDSNNTIITNRTVSINGGTALNGVWTRLRGYFTAPANAAGAMFFTHVASGVAPGETYYFDDMRVERCDQIIIENTGGSYGWISTASGNMTTGDKIYDLNGSSVVAQLVAPAVHVTGDSAVCRMVIFGNYGMPISYQIYCDYLSYSDSWRFSQFNGSSNTAGITAPGSVGKWVRVSLNAGTVYWDTSPDGITWTNRGSQTAGGWPTPVFGTGFVQFYTDSFTVNTKTAWDNFNVLPITAGSDLALTASPSTDTGRGQFLSAQLDATGTPDGNNRYDANAQAALFVSGLFPASILKTLNAASALSITASQSGSGTEFGTAAAALAVTAGTSAAASKNASALAGFTSAGNLSYNWSYEPDTIITNQPGLRERSSTYSRSGGWSYKFTSDGASYLNCASTGYFGVAPGDRFYVEAWVRSDPGNTSTAGSIFIGAQVRSESNAVIQYPAVYALGTQVNSSGWTKFSTIILMPANANNAYFYIQCNPDVPAGQSYYVDDFLIAKFDPLTVNTGGFGSRGQSIGGSQTITADLVEPDGFGIKPVNANLVTYTFPEAQGRRNQFGAANLPVTATQQAVAFETTVSDATLTIAAGRIAAASRRQAITTSLAVEALNYAELSASYTAQTSTLQITASTWVTADEPREIIDVEPDDRDAAAGAEDRQIVLAGETRQSSASPDERAAASGGERRGVAVLASTRVASTAPQSRTIAAPDTDSLAQASNTD